MRTLLPTVTVVIKTSSFSEPDKYGDVKPIFVYEEVKGCLVAPYSSDDRRAPFNLSDETKIIVHIPKTFTKSLSNAEIVYRDTTYKVIGNPAPLVRSPLNWDRNVVCEEI